MMRKSSTSPLNRMEKELDRLYVQKSAVERLIESLEDYQTCHQTTAVQRVRSAAMPSAQKMAS